MQKRRILSRLKPEIKLYRKLRHRKGHGVHSPFAYNLITKVIEEKTPFYAFNDIKVLCKQILSEKNELYPIFQQETQSEKYGALLFRLVNFFKYQSVLEIGSSLGIMSLYLAMPSRNNCQCYSLEKRTYLATFVDEYNRNHLLENLHRIEGDYEKSLTKLRQELSRVDLVFINQMNNAEEIRRVLRNCGSFMDKKTTLIINDIYKNKEMKELWKELKSNPQTCISMDLHALGLLFFDDKLTKKHYKIYFKDGKRKY